MNSRRECEFRLLRYVPDPVRNEFVHVGVILQAVSGEGASGRVASVKFTSDWRRVRCLDPEADTEYLEGLESELRRRFLEEPEGNLMHVLEDSFSNSVQVTRAKAYLAESVDAGVEELMRMYVEAPKREKVSRLTGRAVIQAKMRVEFERAGVWDLLRKRIAGAEYTRAGDPLRIDLGYRSGVSGAGGLVRMFQAISLEAGIGPGSGVESAKGLAFSAAALRSGVERVERVPLELTVVLETVRQRSEVSGPRSGKGRELGAESTAGGMDSEQGEAYRFAVETMEEHGIRVLTTADMGRVAETARRELGV